MVKPLTAVASLILNHYELYDEGSFSWDSGYLYISFVNNVSVSISLYSLGLFYMATEDRLRPFKPFSKFLCIKAVIFFSYWQYCLFQLLIKLGIILGNDLVAVNEAQNVIISVEIVLAAIALSISFSYRVFENESDANQKSLLKAIDEVFTVKDVFQDAQNTFLGYEEVSGKMELKDLGKRPGPYSV